MADGAEIQIQKNTKKNLPIKKIMMLSGTNRVYGNTILGIAVGGTKVVLTNFYSENNKL